MIHNNIIVAYYSNSNYYNCFYKSVISTFILFAVYADGKKNRCVNTV